jgi:beta-galactosidase
MYDYWKSTLENPNVIGDFIWVAYDNLGEAGAGRVMWEDDDTEFCGNYPWLSCFQGDMDLDGNRLPQSYYHKILWGFDDSVHLFTTHPKHTGKPVRGTGWQWYDVQKEWTFGDEYIGKPVKIDAYADCDEVEFILNGKSLGRAVPDKLIASIEVPYEKGVLEAVAYRGGKPAAGDKIATVGAPAKIVLISEADKIKADGLDLAYIRIEIHDKDDALVTNVAVEVAVTVSGAGTLAGLGSGNPCTEESYGTGVRQTWYGKALAVVRAGKESGSIKLTAIAAGIEGAILEISCV